MLRLQVSCSLIPQGDRQKFRSNSSSWVVRFRGLQYWPQQRVCVKALRDEKNGGGSGFIGRNWEPGLEIEVPHEQRPVNEYSSLKDSLLYSWGELSPGPLFKHLGSIWLIAFTVLGVPISAAIFNPSREPLKFVLAAGTGTLFLVSLVVLRIYLVLARDRLLGSNKVKPVIKLLKQTLVGTGVLLVSSVLLFIFAKPVENFFESTLSMKENVESSMNDAKSNMRYMMTTNFGF